MLKRKLKIINFNHLSEDHFDRIREYRNQDFVRAVSLDSKPISKAEHERFRTLLKSSDRHFSYLIKREDQDYGIINIKKLDGHICTIGDYLVDEIFQYEGGGIVNRLCICQVCNRLDLRFVRAKQQVSNTRGNRGGGVFTVEHVGYADGFNEYLSEIPDFDDPRVANSRARKAFDKLYEVDELVL